MKAPIVAQSQTKCVTVTILVSSPTRSSKKAVLNCRLSISHLPWGKKTQQWAITPHSWGQLYIDLLRTEDSIKQSES